MIIYSLTRAFGDAISAAMKFEDVMSRVQGVLPTRSLTDRLQIKKEVIESAQNYSVDLLQAAESAKIFAQQGLAAAQIGEQLAASMLGVQAVGLDPTQAREMLTAVRNITQERIGSFDILDRISRIESRRAVDASSLADALKQAGPIAQQLNGEMSGVVSAMDIVLGTTTQIVEQTRVSGRQAATSLRFILARLGRPQVVKQLESIGRVQLGTAESGGKQLRPLIEILGELAEAYARLKEEGSAGATRFLVALAGARQVNPAAVMLSSVNEAIETARLGSLSFGSTLGRLEIQQETFAAHMTRAQTGLRVFGLGLLETSGFGEIFKATLSGMTTFFEAGGQGAGATTAKVLSLVIGFTALFQVVRRVNTALKTIGILGALNIGAGGIPSAAARASGIGGIGTILPSVGKETTGEILSRATSRQGRLARGPAGQVLGRASIFAGGPQAPIVIGALAFAGALGLIWAAVRKLNETPLALDFLEQKDVDIKKMPRLAAFRNVAEELELAPKELMHAFHNASVAVTREITSLLPENVKDTPLVSNIHAIRDELKFTRGQIISDMIEQVSVDAPGLMDWLRRDIDEGLTEVQERTIIVSRFMELLGNTVFSTYGVFAAHLQQVADGIENVHNTITSTVEAIDNLGSATERMLQRSDQALALFSGAQGGGSFFEALSRLGTGLGGGIGAAGGAFELNRGTFERAIQEVFADAPKGYASLIADMFWSQEDIVKEVVASFGEDRITFRTLFQTLSDEFVIAAQDPTRRAEMVAATAEMLSDALVISEANALQIGITRDNPFEPWLELITELLPAAADEIKKQIVEGKLEGVDPAIMEALENLVSRIGAGVKISMGDVAQALTEIKNPLDLFVKEFYVADQRLRNVSEAAYELGFAFDYVSDRLSMVQDMGKKLANLRLDTTAQILTDIIGIENTAAAFGGTEALELIESISRRADANRVAAAMDALGQGIVEQDASGVNKLQRMTTELKALELILEEWDERNMLESFDPAKYPAARDVHAFYADLVRLLGELPEGGGTPEDIIENLATYHKVTLTVDHLRAAIKAANDEWTNMAVMQDQRLSAIALEAKLSNNVVQSYQRRATVGFGAELDAQTAYIAEFEKLPRVLTNINRIRDSELATAQALFEEETLRIDQREREGTIVSRRDIAGERTAALEQLQIAEQKAELTAQEARHRAETLEDTRLLKEVEMLRIHALTTMYDTQARMQLAVVSAEQSIAETRIDSIASIKNQQLPTVLQLETAFERIGQLRTAEQVTAYQTYRLELARLTKLREERNIAGELIHEPAELEKEKVAAQNELALALNLSNVKAEQERITASILNYENQVTETVDARVENTAGRLEGLKEALKSYETLTKSPERIFAAAGEQFISRQVDLLFEGLFNEKTGLLSSFASALGGAGEVFKPIENAHIYGVIAAAPILTSAYIEGAMAAKAIETGGAVSVGGVSISTAGLTPEKVAALQQQGTLESTTAKFREMQRAQVIQSLASVGGSLGGAFLGGGGKGAQIGAQVGALGGSSLGPLGTFGGGLLGGLVGGLFDGGDDKPMQTLEAIARSSAEQVKLLENTNTLLTASQMSFNLPTGFRLPAYTPFNATAGGVSVGTIQVNVSGDVSNADLLGRNIADSISRELSDQLNASGVYVSRV
jgi:TP901 family phage tail tape measure protein